MSPRTGPDIDIDVLVREHLPLSDAVFHILVALVGGALHGYGVLLEVEERTEGRVVLGTGTLYSAVKRLRRDGLIEETEPPCGEDDDPRRRYYRLTELGRAVTDAEARRLEAMVSFAREKRVLPAS